MSSCQVLDVLARHVPGFGVYGPVLDFQDADLGHGRIRASQEGLIQQHLHILNRIMCQEAGRVFADVEVKAHARLKRAKLGALGFLTLTIATHALFLLEVRGDSALWDDLRAIL